MEPEQTLETLRNIIESRRSIRLFTEDSVPPSVIETALDLALLAPNSSNLQPWEFYWVKNTALRKKLVKACLSQAAANTAPELIVCVAKTNTWDRNRLNMIEQMKEAQDQGTRIPKAAWHYYLNLAPKMYRQGPLGILGFLKKLLFLCLGIKQAICREPSSLSDMKVWATKTTALACENFMLAIQAQGFDSCPMEGIDSWRIKNLLNLSKGSFIVMVIAVGKRRKEGITLPRIRGPKEWFVKVVS